MEQQRIDEIKKFIEQSKEWSPLYGFEGHLMRLVVELVNAFDNQSENGDDAEENR